MYVQIPSTIFHLCKYKIVVAKNKLQYQNGRVVYDKICLVINSSHHNQMHRDDINERGYRKK